MSDEKIETIIVAPHADDEIIGCFEVLMNPFFKPIILYTDVEDENRKLESLNLKKHIPNVNIQLFVKNVPAMMLNPTNILYFPDPVFEFHPDHRRVGAMGEELLRKGLNVIFYSVNMQAPYIHEVIDFKQKRHLLEKVYPSQKNMWKFDAKYYLFEGKNKWLM